MICTLLSYFSINYVKMHLVFFPGKKKFWEIFYLTNFVTDSEKQPKPPVEVTNISYILFCFMQKTLYIDRSLGQQIFLLSSRFPWKLREFQHYFRGLNRTLNSPYIRRVIFSFEACVANARNSIRKW